MYNNFFYEVIYSDGVTVVDSFFANNLKEAKAIAAERSKTINYGTSYYSICRNYNRGIKASSGIKYKNY